MSDLKIVVLGAGVVGLTTAIELKKEFRNASLDVIADKFYDEITSFVAAGIFAPDAGTPGGSEMKTRKLLGDSYNYWEEIRLSPESQEAGVRQFSGYVFSSEQPHITKCKYLEEIVPIFRPATQDELKMCPGDWKYGSYYTTLQTDPTRYLKWSFNKLRHSNVRFIQEKITDFEELGNNYDVVVNCTGIGSQTLCGDSTLVPLRGQVTLVEAPWVKKFFFGETNTYVIPSFDYVVLGGCRQYESYSWAVNRHDVSAIRERCEEMLPSLKTAKLICHRVGLRPYRSSIRLEKEYRNVQGDAMKIVHNYGHGGCGVTLAPGSALNAVQLVRESLSEGRSKL